MQNLLVPTDYVDNEVAKLRREVIEWKDQVKKELQQLRRSNQVRQQALFLFGLQTCRNMRKEDAFWL